MANMANKCLVIANFAKQIIFEDSDEELGQIEKIEGFAETLVPQMCDFQFKIHFRLSVRTFEHLLTMMSRVIVENRSTKKVSLEKELMITVWYLANLESMRSVSQRFNISKSTCWDIIYRTCRLLLRCNEEYSIIRWPNVERRQIISEYFFRTKNFQGVIGCIDGTHIRINAPTNHPNSYVNRKGFHSLLLQGICDHEMKFTDVYCGQPGSLHDYTLLKKSPFYEAVENQSIVIEPNFHLVGDSAYRIHPFLMVPHKNYGQLTLHQIHFNKRLSACRVKIENAYAYLKGRFRRLKYVETVRLDLTVLIIFTCCLFHNVCILNEDVIEILNEDQDVREDIDVPLPLDLEDNVNRAIALHKRNQLTNMQQIV